MLKLVRVDRSGTRTGFGVHFVGAEEVSGAGGRIVLIHQRVSADAAFDLSRQPCVLGFLIRLNLLRFQTLGTAFQPQVGGNDPLVRCQHQMIALQIHLLAAGGILPFVVVAPVCANKIAWIICYDSALVPIELIDG